MEFCRPAAYQSDLITWTEETLFDEECQSLLHCSTDVSMFLDSFPLAMMFGDLQLEEPGRLSQYHPFSFLGVTEEEQAFHESRVAEEEELVSTPYVRLEDSNDMLESTIMASQGVQVDLMTSSAIQTEPSSRCVGTTMESDFPSPPRIVISTMVGTDERYEPSKVSLHSCANEFVDTLLHSAVAEARLSLDYVEYLEKTVPEKIETTLLQWTGPSVEASPIASNSEKTVEPEMGVEREYDFIEPAEAVE
jgi:hypothetical protein